MCLGKVWLLLFGRVCFVGRESFNQFGFERVFRALDHRQTIAALVVLNLVHDVVDEEHAPALSLEEIGRVARVWDVLHVEALTFVFNREARLFR